MIIATLSSPPSTRDYSACAISAAHPASAAFNPSPQRQILKSDALSQASSLPPPLRHDAAVVPFHRCPDAAAHTSPSSPSTAGAAVFPIGHTNRAMATHKIPHAWTTKAPSR
uniref:Uncharacterized protein n=1 Tax=Oryza glumipatula TaxID=40148 RepID=A0A0D9Z935_9ORYZ